MFTIDSLTRFVNCSLLIARASIRGDQVFMGDWVRTIGKPRRIIADRGRPTLSGATWADLSRTFGWKTIRAPQFAPHQNGLTDRLTRSLKTAAKHIISATGATCPSQEISHQSVIAKNRAPHAATGISPALAMAGRRDIPAGHGHTAFTHDQTPKNAIR